MGSADAVDWRDTIICQGCGQKNMRGLCDDCRAKYTDAATGQLQPWLAELVAERRVVTADPAEDSLAMLHAAVRFGAGADVLDTLRQEVQQHWSGDYVADWERSARADHERRSQPASTKPLTVNLVDASVLGQCIVCKSASMGTPCQRCNTSPLWLRTWKDAEGKPLPGYLAESRYRDRHTKVYQRNQQRLQEVGSVEPPPTGKRGQPKKAGVPPRWW